jgi:transcriptional regulator with XRE-family HTH domain
MLTVTPYGRLLGDRVREQRLRRGWTQVELERRSGIPQPQISRLEAGGTDDPGAQTIRNLALALGVSADLLLGLYGEDPERFLRQAPYIAAAAIGP